MVVSVRGVLIPPTGVSDEPSGGAKIPLPAPPTFTDAGGHDSASSTAAKGKPAVPAIQQERILQHAWHLKKNGYMKWFYQYTYDTGKSN